jgi:hypothetical protein
MALDTVVDYLAQARVLLQDKTYPPRYPDTELVEALNLAMMEARRLRPDLYLGDATTLFTVPSIGATDPMGGIDVQYRVPLLYYMVGHAMQRDEEENNENRALSYKQRFSGMLLSTVAV